MILELYGQIIRLIARSILLLASVIFLLIFVVAIATLFDDKIEHYPPVAFILAPFMSLVSYYASRFLAPPPSRHTMSDTSRIGGKKAFELSIEEWDCLLQALPTQERESLQHNIQSGRVVLQFNIEESEELSGALTERLAKVGFDKDYKPTEEGEFLEALIDKLYSA
jgi:hypothetical protein